MCLAWAKMLGLPERPGSGRPHTGRRLIVSGPLMCAMAIGAPPESTFAPAAPATDTGSARSGGEAEGLMGDGVAQRRGGVGENGGAVAEAGGVHVELGELTKRADRLVPVDVERA